MEYLDNRNKKTNTNANLDIGKLTGDGELTKTKPNMSSFKLYTGKKKKVAKKKASKLKVDKKDQKKITKKSVAPKHKYKIEMFNIVSLTDKMLFMDNMSTMLRAGLSLTPALKTIKNEIKNKYFKEVLEYLVYHIENGQSLSSGMKNYPKVFSGMIIATIEVGENTGMLSDTFGHLADIMKRQKELRNKVIGAMMYPVIVILALLVVSGFLAMVIFPQLIDLFQSGGVKLPFVLVAVQTFNFIVRNYWHLCLGGLFGLIVLFKIIFSKQGPKLLLSRAILKTPFLGKINQELALTRFAGNLNALLAAGLGIVQSMEIVAKTVGNLQYKEEILLMAKELEKGQSLQIAMAKRPDLFPSLTIQLVQVGETTGQLEEILAKISEFYGDRVDSVLNNLSTILEPVLLVIVGIAVGFIAVSVIGPMYELTNSFAE
ncbi:MAG: type II secretion system F family protein [Candidatus Komeilibacteria bacterium]|jgi:type IV pilus assembly protein PilC|nr:type II secretion system F family protein [Candidatus Komeilibacteria bacterium]MBT4447412.1 type II secretion system F family protein [Candidatus Komeilibacteria bacterium]